MCLEIAHHSRHPDALRPCERFSQTLDEIHENDFQALVAPLAHDLAAIMIWNTRGDLSDHETWNQIDSLERHSKIGLDHLCSSWLFEDQT